MGQELGHDARGAQSLNPAAGPFKRDAGKTFFRDSR